MRRVAKINYKHSYSSSRRYEWNGKAHLTIPLFFRQRVKHQDCRYLANNDTVIKTDHLLTCISPDPGLSISVSQLCLHCEVSQRTDNVVTRGTKHHQMEK